MCSSCQCLVQLGGGVGGGSWRRSRRSRPGRLGHGAARTRDMRQRSILEKLALSRLESSRAQAISSGKRHTAGVAGCAKVLVNQPHWPGDGDVDDGGDGPCEASDDGQDTAPELLACELTEPAWGAAGRIVTKEGIGEEECDHDVNKRRHHQESNVPILHGLDSMW